MTLAQESVKVPFYYHNIGSNGVADVIDTITENYDSLFIEKTIYNEERDEEVIYSTDEFPVDDLRCRQVGDKIYTRAYVNDKYTKSDEYTGKDDIYLSKTYFGDYFLDGTDVDVYDLLIVKPDGTNYSLKYYCIK